MKDIAQCARVRSTEKHVNPGYLDLEPYSILEVVNVSSAVHKL